VRAVATVLAKRRLRATLLAATPLLALLVTIRTLGAFVGLLNGPGESVRYIR
jgi:hypothetical protein